MRCTNLLVCSKLLRWRSNNNLSHWIPQLGCGGVTTPHVNGIYYRIMRTTKWNYCNSQHNVGKVNWAYILEVYTLTTSNIVRVSEHYAFYQSMQKDIHVAKFTILLVYYKLVISIFSTPSTNLQGQKGMMMHYMLNAVVWQLLTKPFPWCQYYRIVDIRQPTNHGVIVLVYKSSWAVPDLFPRL